MDDLIAFVSHYLDQLRGTNLSTETLCMALLPGAACSGMTPLTPSSSLAIPGPRRTCSIAVAAQHVFFHPPRSSQSNGGVLLDFPMCPQNGGIWALKLARI